MSRNARSGSRSRRGQAMVEFAVALPVLLLLAVGGIELGRAYVAATAVSDAARDGARLGAGKTPAGNGIGMVAICALVRQDLATLTATVACPPQIGHPPPFASPGDFAAPAGGQAVLLVFCGAIVNCQGVGSRLYQAQIDVWVYYGFNDVNLLGGAFTVPGSSRSRTSW